MEVKSKECGGNEELKENVKEKQYAYAALNGNRTGEEKELKSLV